MRTRVQIAAASVAVSVALSACVGAHGPDGTAPDAATDAGATIDASSDAGLSCRFLRAELRRELDAIVACTEDADCGLELDPRCGCSSDRVARLDADTSRFDGLAEEYRARCADLRSVVLDRECTCHEPAEPRYACANGMCIHAIEAPQCVYDGAAFRIHDGFPDADDSGLCSCVDVGDGADVTCTLGI